MEQIIPFCISITSYESYHIPIIHELISYDRLSEFLRCFIHGEKSWLNRSYLFLAKSINFSRFGRPPFLEDVLVPPKKRQVCQRRRRRPPCRWRSSCCGTWGRWERRQRGVAWRGNRGPINKQMK